MEPQVIRIREQRESQPLLRLTPELCAEFRSKYGSRVVCELREGVNALEAWIEEENGEPTLYCSTSYFIGLAWIIPGCLAVCVEPKMNRRLDDEANAMDVLSVDVLAMLKEALEDEENFEHLDGLQYLYSEQPAVPVQKEEQGLKLFLIVQFLCLMDRIRRQGVKRSFYNREESFHYKMKGRIELSRSLRSALTPTLVDRLTCAVQQFDVDTPANQYLKRALKKSLDILQQSNRPEEKLIEKARQGLVALEGVSNRSDAAPVRVKKVNPMFRVYSEALRLAEQILAQESLGYKERQGKTLLPVHWIDMSKLFELYVFRKLRKAVGESGTLQYHFKAHWQELDYLGRAPATNDFPVFVADAKYKPRYSETVVKEDLRQVSGYARLESVAEELHEMEGIIPCLIIYPKVDEDAPAGGSIDLNAAERIRGWMKFYKTEVKLPIKQQRRVAADLDGLS